MVFAPGVIGFGDRLVAQVWFSVPPTCVLALQQSLEDLFGFGVDLALEPLGNLVGDPSQVREGRSRCSMSGLELF
jgi:hypothetical protein